MARIVRTDLLDYRSLDESVADWIYNGLDCCVTVEVAEELKPSMGLEALLVYRFNRAMLGPAMEMMLRGTLVDRELRDEEMKIIDGHIKRLEYILDRYAEATWGKPLNSKSHAQLKTYFYEYMDLPVHYRNDKGRQVPTTNRAALEKLSGEYFYAEPIVKVILALSDIRKLRSVLVSGIDRDGRMRVSYNVGATETDRWSSSKNVFGTGTNDQNITDRIRRIFIAEEHRKFGNLDLEQAESRVVAYASQDENYIAACNSGDLHTWCAQLAYPELDWPGDGSQPHFRENLPAYKEVAEQLCYRHFTYRDILKRGGHATNYYGQPYTIAQLLGIEERIVSEFQDRYLFKFHRIPSWHAEVAERLQVDGYITTCLGFRRDFLGRRDEDATLREAIAFEPQSVVAQILNTILWLTWRYLREEGVWILKQGHDSFLFSYLEKKEERILARVKELAHVPFWCRGREVVIPAEISTGWNWGKYNDKEEKGPVNLGGLSSKTPDARKRDRPAFTPILDRVVHGVH